MIALPFRSSLTMLVVQWQLLKRNAKIVFIFSFQSFLVDMLSLLEALPIILDMQCFCLRNWRFDGKSATELMSAGTHTEALHIISISSWDTDWIWCNPGFCASNAINCQSDLFIQNQIWWAPFTIKKLWEKSSRNLSFSIFSPFSTLICGSTTTRTFEIL